MTHKNDFLLIGNEQEEGETCPDCRMQAQWRECCHCGLAAWIIDCGHFCQPRPLAAGKADGSHGQQTYCQVCADEEDA